MKKYIIGIAVVLLIGIYFYGCKEELPETPNVHTEKIIQNGAGIRFEWDPVENADGYRVYADGKEVYEGTNTYYELLTPTMKVEIVAYNKEGESEPWVGDYTPATGTGEIWERSVQDKPSAYGWDAKGNGASYSILDTTNYSRFDFYLDDLQAGTTLPGQMYFVSPNYNYFGAPFNNTETGFAVGTGDVAPAPDGVYDTPRTEDPVAGQTYFLWIDHSANGWSTDDNFVKLTVTSIGNDGKVTFNYCFQKKGGLRWVKSK